MVQAFKSPQNEDREPTAGRLVRRGLSDTAKMGRSLQTQSKRSPEEMGQGSTGAAAQAFKAREEENSKKAGGTPLSAEAGEDRGLAPT